MTIGIEIIAVLIYFIARKQPMDALLCAVVLIPAMVQSKNWTLASFNHF